MLNIFSLSNLLLYTAVLLLSLFVVNWIIRPYKRIRSYRREHITTEFFPVIGILKSLLKDLNQKDDMIASIRTASVDYPNQKVFISNMNKTVVFMLRDPQYIKEFLLNQNHYHKEKVTHFLMPLIGTGLLFAEDEVWKRHRRIISGSFHYEFIKENTALIQQTTKEFLDHISPNDYKDFDVINRIQDITGEVVGRVFFGENLNSYAIDGKRLTQELGSLASDLCMCGTNLIVFIFGHKALNLPIPQFTKIMKRVRVFREKCFAIIQDRKNRPVQSKDLLASLLSLQNSQDPRERYSDEDIVNEFITFFIAGMETTGHLIGMSLYELTQYPQYLQELKEERDRTYNKEKVITTETLQKMDVLHSFFKETLRFFTPVPGVLGRCAIEDHQLLDLKIKKGDALVPHFYSVFFNSKYFKDPQEFSPARWRDPNQQIDAFAFTPFSAGPRNCIGQHMAILEAKTIVSEFLERFSFKVKEGYKLKMIGRFSYEPVDPLLFDLSPIKLE